MITKLAISGYRSLRDIRLSLERVNIITGANGSGKSSLFKALKMLADTSNGQLFSSLAKEGGFPSTLWAGPEQFSRQMKTGEAEVQGTIRKNAVSLKLGFASDTYSYLVDLGLPKPHQSAFSHDPEIKQEYVWHGEIFRPSTLIAKRLGPYLSLKDNDRSQWVNTQMNMATFDSIMTHGMNPHLAPELLALRENMREWRFYDHFRTDQDAPARISRIGTHTPVLDAGGASFAAALQTIREIGDVEALDLAIDEAFPKSRIEVDENDGRFEIVMRQHGLLRPLRTAELSDGTLRYLLLTTALLSPRPPSLLVLNEPENSLHPSLLEPLARLIMHAAQSAQIIVVSHAESLVHALEAAQHCLRYDLVKEFGETRIEDAEYAKWQWPKR